MPRCRRFHLDAVGHGNEVDSATNIILRKHGDVSWFASLHESIIHNILDHMELKDVLKMRQTSKYMNNIIDRETIARSTLRNHGHNITFCRAVYTSHYDLLRRTVHKVDTNRVFKGLIYSVYTGRNDVARFLMDNVKFSDTRACRCCLLRVSTSFCDRKCYNCCRDFMKEEDPFPIQFQDLFTIACSGNNVEMVKYLWSKNVRWTQIDIKVCIKNYSNYVLEYLCNHKRARVPKTLVFEVLNDIFIENKFDILEDLLQRKIIKLGACYSFGIANMLCYEGISRDQFVRLLDKYGSRRLMRNILKAAIHNTMERVIESILTNVDIKITKKHLDYIHQTKNLHIELLIVNKYELQQRMM